MRKAYLLVSALLVANYCLAQTNTFPSSGNVGIGTTTPATTLEVNGDIKSNTTNYDYYNIVNLSTYDANTWYPVVLTGNGVGGPVKFEIIRNNVHEDANWYGTIHFMGIFNSHGWGNTSDQFVYKYEESPTVNLVSYVGQQGNGAHIIVFVRGGRHYYIKSNTPIENVNSLGASYTMDSGSSDYQITVSPSTDLNGNPLTSLPAGGIEYITWRKVSENTALAASGNIGIGTSSPTQRLEVQGNGARIRLSTASDPSNYYFDIESNYDAANTVNFYAATGINILKYIFNSNSVCLQPASGNVLIGKTSQTNTSYKLDVNGNIRANEVVVNTTGADFVFDSSYSLPPLSKVADYIRVNKHLPGVATSKQMQSNGISLGDNQAKLLQKVEELTLYVIQQDKKNDYLEKRMSGLAQANIRLQRELTKLKSEIAKTNHQK